MLFRSRYKEQAYEMGLKVYTTIRVDHQNAANAALRAGVLAYDRRHGYRGPEAYTELPANASEEAMDDVLHEYTDSEDISTAIVVEAGPKRVKAYHRSGEWLEITDAGLKFAAEYLTDRVNPNQRIRRGAVIRVQQIGRAHV